MTQVPLLTSELHSDLRLSWESPFVGLSSVAVWIFEGWHEKAPCEVSQGAFFVDTTAISALIGVEFPTLPRHFDLSILRVIVPETRALTAVPSN